MVNGTSLALQLGHRNSIDIDLVAEALNENHEFSTTLMRNNTILATVDAVKTDFIKQDYPFILTAINEEGIGFLSKEDISAIKLHAIVQSGKRLIDFIDVYC